MPLIEFQCESCKLVFERLIRTGKPETHACPCGKQAKRRLSKFGVSAQGAGFRATDHATVDTRIGADADDKREYYKDRYRTLTRLREKNPGKKVALNQDRSFVVVD